MVEFVLGLLGHCQLLLDLALDLLFKLLLQALHASLVGLHLGLVVGFLEVVFVDRVLNVCSDFVVFVHLLRTLVLL